MCTVKQARVLRQASLQLYVTNDFGPDAGRHHASYVSAVCAVLPAREVLEIAQASAPPPRPVPNLG